MLPVQGHVTRFKLDTGSQVNILPVKELKKIVGKFAHLFGSQASKQGY